MMMLPVAGALAKLRSEVMPFVPVMLQLPSVMPLVNVMCPSAPWAEAGLITVRLGPEAP